MKIPDCPVRQDPTTGTWYVDYRFRGQRRKPRIGDRDDAEQYRLRVRECIRRGMDPEQELKQEDAKARAQKLRLAEFWKAYDQEHVTTLSANTARLYRYLFEKNISAHPIARLRLTEIGRQAIADYQRARQGGGLSVATINREVGLIKRMLGMAYQWEILDNDPRGRIKLQRENNRRDVSNIRPEQIKALVAALPEHLAAVVEFAVYTGLRKENILSLKIEQAVIPDIGPGAAVRLTVKGNREQVFPLGDAALEVFRRAAGVRGAGHVFINPLGKRLVSPHKRIDQTIRAQRLAIADGRKLCFHDFRRLFGTWALNSGLSLDQVREFMGHADRATTDRYARRAVSGEMLSALPRVR